MTATLLLLSSIPDSRAEKIIQIEMSDASVAPTEVAVADVSRIKFNTGVFSLEYHDSDATNEFSYVQVKRITFKDGTAVKTVDAADQVVIMSNPVRESLLLKGGELLYGKDINLYSITGMHVLRVPAWNGETIDVSHFAPGVYIINTQSATLKFVKL